MVKIFFRSRKINCLIMVALLFVVAGADMNQHRGEPSAGARGMPGAEGTIEFKPKDWHSGETTWWKDTDGVSPGIAGCHIGTDSKGKPNGRMFGEACLANGLLVESNPGKGVLHRHVNDIGHPDTFDCNAWCIGDGKTSGICEAAPAHPCDQSALCVCK